MAINVNADDGSGRFPLAFAVVFIENTTNQK